jgi:hypothetical protein
MSADRRLSVYESRKMRGFGSVVSVAATPAALAIPSIYYEVNGSFFRYPRFC